jgi:protein-S-isoprenylcysteine O-methyltransferase Ste14
MITAFKTLLFTVFVPGTVAIWIPYRILSTAGTRGTISIGGFRYVGLVMMTIGALIYLWCAWDFTFAGKGTPAPIDPPRELVVSGLYRYIRNPMYVGVLSVVLGQAVWFEALRLFVYAGLVFVLFSMFVLIYEEPVLSRKFGNTYKQYCKRVPRWIPRFRRSPDAPDNISISTP